MKLSNGFKTSMALTLGCFVLFIVSGCSLNKIHSQTQIVENSGFIKGAITLSSSQKGSVVVLHFHDEQGIPVLKHQIVISKNGTFGFSVLPGKNYIAAFIDVNNDGQYQTEEHGNYYGRPSIIDVASKQTVTLEPITISGPAPEIPAEIKPISKITAIWTNIGEVVKLDDPRFTQENYEMGLWKPFDFLDRAEGGVFFLDEYQTGKVPVLFVHGVMGGPTNFKKMISDIDKRSFQSWVVYYPSGLRLDMISDYVVEAVSRLQNKYDFPEFYVIAHSMGGLVARSFVKKYVHHAPGNLKRLKLVMTVNSPMGGMPSAATGVKYSPIVIPSWRDVEPGSEFLNDLHKWNWPLEIPYHLVVSYTTKDSGDGVVPLQSQVPLKLQAESTRLYIFNNHHAGTLEDNDFLTLFNKILSDNLKNL